MDLSSPATSLVLFWTITRAVALAVLATEALFLLRRSRNLLPEATATSRLVWSATPALVLAGLSLWCLASLPSVRAPSGAGPTAIASSSPSPR